MLRAEATPRVGWDRTRVGLLVAALFAGLALMLASVPSAHASGLAALDHAGGSVEEALKEEDEASGHTRAKALPHLKEAVELLIDAREDIEDAFDFGALGTVEASAIDNLLKEAIAQDRDAEAADLSVTERDRHIKRAIELKQEILTQIGTEEAKHFLNPFTAPLTPPGAPPPWKLGSSLTGTPAPLLGEIEEDAEFWGAFYAAAAGIGGVDLSPTIPGDGWITGVYVKGNAVSGDMPGPGGSQPFRVGIEQPQTNGQLKVISTSNPPFELPGTSGLYYFWVGPPYTQFAMPVMKGEILSFDTRGGTWSIFSSIPGSSVDSAAGTGLQQNPGMLWSPIPHPNVELDVQWLIEPLVPVLKLQSASMELRKAINLDDSAEKARRNAGRNKALDGALGIDKLVSAAINEGAGQGELSAQSASILSELITIAQDNNAEATHAGKGRHAKGEQKHELGLALSDEQLALKDLASAKSLAEKVV